MIGERWIRGRRRNHEVSLFTVQRQVRDLTCLVIVRVLTNFFPRMQRHVELFTDWLDPGPIVFVVGGEEEVWLTLLVAQIYDNFAVGIDRILIDDEARILDGHILHLFMQKRTGSLLFRERLFASIYVSALLSILALELENLEAVLLCANLLAILMLDVLLGVHFLG